MKTVDKKLFLEKLLDDFKKSPLENIKQYERIKELEAENRRMREALQSWIDINRGAPNKYNWAEQALKG